MTGTPRGGRRNSKRISDITAEQRRQLYTCMVRIRRFEDTIHLRFLQGTLPGTVHLYQGQEAVAVGACAHLTSADVIASTHRPHGHAIAKGVPLRQIMAELYGKVTGCCRGKGGSMHIGDPDAGMLPAIAIVGGGLTIAVGCALGFKMQRTDSVAVSFFGDGATNEGDFHEALNMAAVWNLPVVFICENNLYGASTRINLVSKVENLADRAASYGMPSAVCDGNDVEAVHACVGDAVQRARRGGGPTLLECKTYRLGGHSRSDANAYRDKAEEAYWRERDPLHLAETRLLSAGILTADDVARIERDVQGEIDDATAYAESSPLPDPAECFTDVLI